jgi:hypothetical protein
MPIRCAKADGPLRNGKPLVALPGKSIDALIDAQLNDIGTIGRLIEQGHQGEARSILLPLLEAPVLDPERAHYVSVMFLKLRRSMILLACAN